MVQYQLILKLGFHEQQKIQLQVRALVSENCKNGLDANMCYDTVLASDARACKHVIHFSWTSEHCVVLCCVSG